jgi:hypothetical protein
MSTAIIPRGDGIGWTEAVLENDGTLKVQEKEEVDFILKINEHDRNSHTKDDFGKGTQTSMRKLGTISLLQMQNLIEQGIWDDDVKLRKWFKDLDNYLWSAARGSK